MSGIRPSDGLNSEWFDAPRTTFPYCVGRYAVASFKFCGTAYLQAFSLVPSRGKFFSHAVQHNCRRFPLVPSRGRCLSRAVQHNCRRFSLVPSRDKSISRWVQYKCRRLLLMPSMGRF